ncbi:Segregation and condensation protein A [Methanosarcinaceae archaeon Ag5]|uniref:Segregation and condensation protein A n=1 Tax=Methanolapillus africanus TaxID=3028297 RepID=A0AAE4MKM9_9EURY|nr:Segregation and condensation protein A [Methanosarcinaceae archaeon Ag5]
MTSHSNKKEMKAAATPALKSAVISAASEFGPDSESDFKSDSGSNSESNSGSGSDSHSGSDFGFVDDSFIGDETAFADNGRILETSKDNFVSVDGAFVLSDDDDARSYFIDSLGDSLNDSGIDVDKLDFSSFIGNEPIEILVELAKSGKINPWNIDIVQVTDTFLNKVEELERMDLRISGRTLLYSCVLLRMKSTGLFLEEPVVEDEWIVEDEWNVDDDFDISEFPAPVLPIRREARRPVTLKELIEELKKAEKDVIKRRERLADSPKRYIDVELTTEDVVNIAHDEAILKRTGSLLDILRRIFQTQEFVTIDDIFSLENSDKIMDYITLLFLASMKEIVLYQEVIFGDLFIYPFGVVLDESNAIETEVVSGGKLKLKKNSKNENNAEESAAENG